MVSWDFSLCALYLPIPSLFQANVYFSSAMQIFRRAPCTKREKTKYIQITTSVAQVVSWFAGYLGVFFGWLCNSAVAAC